MGVTRLGILHLFGVSMVSGDEKNVTMLVSRIVDSAHSLIGSRHRFNRRFINTGMTNLEGKGISIEEIKTLKKAYHIWWSEVAHHEILVSFREDLDDLVSYSLHTHRRLLVVRSHLGRGYHVS
jgi:hypothetical protein